MRTLISTKHFYLGQDFLLACPKLSIVRSITVQMFHEPYLNSIATEATFNPDDYSFRSNIANRIHLRLLGLIYAEGRAYRDDEEENKTRIARLMADFVSVAVSLGPQLQSLRMTLPLELFWGLISVLPGLSQLRSLALEFRDSPTLTHDASISPLHVQHLKALSLQFPPT